MLRLTHMDTIPIRELQQHSSAAIRRVRNGESVGITDRGTLVAVLVPPTAVGGAGALLAAGRVRTATCSMTDLPAAIKIEHSSGDVLQSLREDR